MKDNTVNIQDVDIYLDNINIYADEYINTVLCISPDNENYKKEVSDSFVDMIFYIADHIQKPSNDNIELLDKMFNTYVRLCSKYHVLPTLEVFSFLVGINRTTFTDWMNGVYRTNSSHGDTAKKWFDICKNCAINRLHNQTGTNANLIFVAKAAYGMAETAPVQRKCIDHYLNQETLYSTLREKPSRSHATTSICISLSDMPDIQKQGKTW